MTSVRLAAGVLFAGASMFAVTIPTGPAVGQKAFDFDLKDQKGAPRNLASIMGPKGAMVVFYRSCDW
jgi:hypothetical protein